MNDTPENVIILDDSMMIECDSAEEAAMIENVLQSAEFAESLTTEEDITADLKNGQGFVPSAEEIDADFAVLDETLKMAETYIQAFEQELDVQLQWNMSVEASVSVLEAYRNLMMVSTPVTMAAFLKESANLLYVSAAFLVHQHHAPADTVIDQTEEQLALYTQASGVVQAAATTFLDNSDMEELLTLTHASKMSMMDDDGTVLKASDGRVLAGVDFEEADLTHLSLVATAQMFLYQAAVF